MIGGELWVFKAIGDIFLIEVEHFDFAGFDDVEGDGFFVSAEEDGFEDHAVAVDMREEFFERLLWSVCVLDVLDRLVAAWNENDFGDDEFGFEIGFFDSRHRAFENLCTHKTFHNVRH